MFLQSILHLNNVDLKGQFQGSHKQNKEALPAVPVAKVTALATHRLVAHEPLPARHARTLERLDAGPVKAA